MAAIAFAAPILPGKLEAWRRFNQETLGSRRAEYEDSRRQIGITKELAWLQQTPMGDFAVVYLEAEDLARVFEATATSDHPFDRWHREQVLEAHGIDMAADTEGFLTSLEFEWEAAPALAH